MLPGHFGNIIYSSEVKTLENLACSGVSEMCIEYGKISKQFTNLAISYG